MIPGLAQALFSVLHGFRRAVTDTGHAVGAVAAPDGLAVLNVDIVRRAERGALPAADAGVAGGESLGFDAERIEDRVHRAAHEAVIKIIAGQREGLICRNSGECTVNVRLRPGHDLPCLVRMRRVEHGNVIFRHDDLRRAHISKLFLPAERKVILFRVADLAAAGHDKPHLLCAGKVRFYQPIPHNARNAPRICGRDDNQTLVRLDRRSIARFDAVIHAEKFVVQSNRDALCHIPAVPGTGIE